MLTARKEAEIAVQQPLGKLEVRVQEGKAELSQANEEHRILSRQLLSAEETERKRIAGEIHDSIGQALSAIKFSLENSIKVFQDNFIQLDLAPLEAIVPLIQKTIEEVRGIVMDLRPSILDDLGILATINWFCREFENIYTTIIIQKEIAIQEEEIPPPLKTVIYRILQEALNNVAKHSQADRVRLSMRKKDAGLELTLADNGKGFDVESTLSSNPSIRGVGLASIRERAELSGGFYTIESGRDKGTNIFIWWPL